LEPKVSPETDLSGGGLDGASDYPATTVENAAELRTGMSRARVSAGLRRRANWEQLVKFCLVGASGYAVNLFVFSFVFLVLGVHYIPAAICAFVVAVTNNYTWNRLWTFRAQRGHFAFQGMRFLVVSTLALGANLVVLTGLVALGLPEVLAQAIAVVLVTPINFLGNKFWSFGLRS
jgi:putative flippase GtrA